MELLGRGALAGPCCGKQSHEILWKDPIVELSAGSNMQLLGLDGSRDRILIHYCAAPCAQNLPRITCNLPRKELCNRFMRHVRVPAGP